MSRRPRLGVLVPARDEAASLSACLDAVATATAGVGERAEVEVLVVLDACADASADAVTVPVGGRPPRVHAITAGNVGVSRAAGAAILLAGSRPVDWIATTDADSRVPPDWLAAHLDAFEAGDDALLGTVAVVDWQHHPPATRAWFAAVHDGRRDTHPHVHGANLGVRAGAYRAVGGFPPLALGEDVALVERLERAGARLRRTRAVPVTTSARATPRAAGGFAHRLAAAGAPRAHA